MRAYLLKAVKRLKKEASWRSADLKKQCIELVSVLEGSAEAEGANTDEVVIEEARSAAPLFDSADPYAHIFKAALESRQSRLMEISLDALHYLIEHDYLKGKEVVNPETNLTLMDDILETVCKCEDEYDEVIQVQVRTHASSRYFTQPVAALRMHSHSPVTSTPSIPLTEVF